MQRAGAPDEIFHPPPESIRAPPRRHGLDQPFGDRQLSAAETLPRRQVLAGTSVGAVYTLQGVYAYELIHPRHLGTVLGIQQAVFAIGGATGPASAGALLGATGSYAPAISFITAGFAGAAGVLLLGQRHDPAAAHSLVY
jgi:MFS family permease